MLNPTVGEEGKNMRVKGVILWVLPVAIGILVLLQLLGFMDPIGGLALILIGVGSWGVLLNEYRRQRRQVSKKSVRRSEQPASSPTKEFVSCPSCGARYDTEMLAASILRTSPFMAGMASWATQVVCPACRKEIAV